MFRSAGLASVVVVAAVAGCREPVTEVVLVVESELAVPDEVDTIAVLVTTDGVPNETHAGISGGLPATMGLLPSGSDTTPFSVEVRGFHQQLIAVVARATGVRFVHGQRRALRMLLRRACACQGTACPTPGTPGCGDVVDPVLPPFDPGNLPPLFGGDGRDAGPGLPPADAAVERASDAGLVDTGSGADRGADLARSDGSPDARADAAAEAPPADGRRPCTAGVGGCSTDCATGTYCDSNGVCVPGFTAGFCQVGGCTCAAGLTCKPPDGSGAGQCLPN